MMKHLRLAVCMLILAAGCQKRAVIEKDLSDFEQVNLIANKAIYSPALVDTNLQNAWGLAWAPSGVAWPNSQASGVSNLYLVTPAIARKAVNIPSPTDSVGGKPTGIVFNSTKGFLLPDGSTASFIFDGVDGVVSAWNGTAGNNAFRIANNSETSAYTGLTLGSTGGANFLYAADFRAGKIAVWDTAWDVVTKFPFHDPSIPRGFSPFNIQSVGSWLYVTYAKVGANGRQQAGAGLGFVDVFNPDGTLVSRFASGGVLNAPWGVVEAPAAFLQQSDVKSSESSSSTASTQMEPTQPVILIGNFGNGWINVFTTNGVSLGYLQSKNRPIVIPGLWALNFAPTTATTISQNWLFFTSGPANETDGIWGYLTK
jgi:uncharacterized protein (TIGR03118 family)